ncbi:MAG: C4-type zinc ribbon domain-containing protein [Chitinophagales bacterium]|nr:C4-type zinc ribbon domain-containing protein [Chitinophagales bacterium]
MAAKRKTLSVDKKLKQLTQLQDIHTQMDKIRILRGELPMEVADLEDEVSGMNIRYEKLKNAIEEGRTTIIDKKHFITDNENTIIKYDKQLNSVKNNREFDALTKEIEMRKLDIQLAEKKIREAEFSLSSSENLLQQIEAQMKDVTSNLEVKKSELGHIVAETEKEEQELEAKASEIEEEIDPKLLAAYKRIRTSYKNGLAVVEVVRDACGGCFGKIPPQTQAEIRLKKKINICEHCGRVLADVDDTEKDEDFIPASALKKQAE